MTVIFASLLALLREEAGVKQTWSQFNLRPNHMDYGFKLMLEHIVHFNNKNSTLSL